MLDTPASVEELTRQDQAHIIHPLYHPEEHASPIIFVEGRGAVLKDAEGIEYIDGLSCLWNVNAGHGRAELAEAAAEQMRKLAFVVSYTGTSNIPAILLAEKLTSLVYPQLNSVYFTTAGAESNESAFKTARFHWKAKGRPDKVKVISRLFGYHGVTLAAMSATGIPPYWKMFEPRVPNFVHIEPPYRLRSEFRDLPDDEFGIRTANLLEEAILREGPETVAAFIAEPVQGAGGVIVPPKSYFPRVREICDQYDVLLIADEVITGFGRTGKWFALEHWGVQPDIMSFAKGITSAALPLGGIVVSDEIRDAIDNVGPDSKYMHAATYSGHATCCAVGLRNIQILEEENLVERAAEMGARLLAGLQELSALPIVGDVRGLGLMAAVELVADREKPEFFDPSLKVGERVFEELKQRGVYTRIRGDAVLFAPPLVISEQQVDHLVEATGASLRAVTVALGR
jgi:adenosylmethionine-8-amino-7-oxononanoate aminotransferase